MKLKVLQILIVTGMAMVLTAAASAQTAQRYRAEIGFGFSIGGHEFAAGEYVIERSNAASATGGLKITSVETGKSKIFNAIVDSADDSDSANRLVFNRYGDRYYLQTIETPTLTARIGRSRAEIIVAKSASAERVTVALAGRKTR